jgi:hypothetical protein
VKRKIGAISLVIALTLALVLPFGTVIAQECNSTCANSVYDYSQGTEKGGSTVDADRSDPNDAFGPIDHDFFSLGFVDETSGGWIIVEFEEYVGTCLTVVEQSPGTEYQGTGYPLEQAEVYVSADSENPTNWTYLGIANNQITGGTQTGQSHPNIFDLEECIKFVKIVDITDPTPFSNTADAFDVDSVCAGPCPPKCGDLIAGQYIDVGDVIVSNDASTLYVTYEITEPDWVITETHLYVGKNLSPTTAPGQFPYDDDDATSVTDTEVTYEILLDDIDSYSMELNKKGNPTGKMVADGTPGVVPCNDTYIAAHAVVQKTTVITAAPYYASTVVDVSQGLRKDGTPVLPARSTPEQGLAFETGQNESNFFSLGFGGWIIVEFDCPISNGEGNDVQVIEDTWGSYPVETAYVYASQDGINWTYLGEADNTTRYLNIHTITDLDLDTLDWAKYIKVVDTTDPSVHNAAADGYDLNAVVSLQDCVEIEEETAWGSCETNGGEFPSANLG